MADYFEEDVLAYVHFDREGDRRNKILITKKQLIVVRNRKEHTFDVNDIKMLKITSRKLLLPLITGGIIFPFSMLSMFTGFFSPYILLLVILTSLYLLYIGFTGHSVVCLDIQPKGFDIVISQVTENIRSFVNFVNTLLPMSNVPKEYRMIYLPLGMEVYDQWRVNGIIQNPGQAKFEAYTYEQWQNARVRYQGSNWAVLMIDPLKVSAHVHYQSNRRSGDLQPFLEGKINLDAVEVITG